MEWNDIVTTGVKQEGVIRGECLMSRGQPLRSMEQFSAVGSVSGMAGEWSHRDECL